MKKVLCWGTFDVLHKGHIDFLKDAKSRGDELIVIVISDKAVFENKKRYPKNKQNSRAKALRKLGIVDKIISVQDNFETNLKLIASIKPGVIVFGHDQSTSIEKTLKNFLNSKKIHPEYHRSRVFAGGVHSSDLGS